MSMIKKWSTLALAALITLTPILDSIPLSPFNSSKAKASSVNMPYVSGSVMTINVDYDYKTTNSTCSYHNDVGIIDLIANTVLEYKTVYTGSGTSGVTQTTKLSFSRDNFIVGRKYAIKYINDNTSPTTCSSYYKNPNDASNYIDLISYFVGGDPGNGTLTNVGDDPASNGNTNTNTQTSNKWTGLDFINGNKWVSSRGTNVTPTFNNTAIYALRAEDMPGTGYTLDEINGKVYITGGFVGSTAVYNSSLREFDPATNTWAPMGTVDGPSPVYGAETTVYNGELYHFGGYNGVTNFYSKEFRKYNPNTKTWTLLASPSVCSGYDGTLVAIGTKMYMYGGYSSCGGYMGGSGIIYVYDITTNTWTTPTVTGFGSSNGRYGHSAVAYNGAMYMYGGYVRYGGEFNDFWKFDPTNNTWTQIAPSSSTDITRPGLAYFHDAFVYNNKMYIHSGYGSGGGGVGLYAYDFATQTWNKTYIPNIGRFSSGGYSAIANINDTVFALTNTDYTYPAKFSKYNISGNIGTLYYHTPDGNEQSFPKTQSSSDVIGNNAYIFDSGGSLYKLDIITSKWTKEIWSPYTGAIGNDSVQAYNGNLYIIGGYKDNATTPVEQPLYSYNSLTNVWTYMGKSSGTRPVYHQAASISVLNGEIYVIGGQNSYNNYFSTADVWVYNIATSTWSQRTTTGSIPIRHNHTAEVYNNKIYIYGGNSYTTTAGCASRCAVGDTWEFDPATNVFTNLNIAPTGKISLHTSKVLGNRMYIYGGIIGDTSIAPLQPVYFIDLDTKTSGAATMYVHPAIRYFAASFIHNGYVYFYGGQSASVYPPSGTVYDYTDLFRYNPLDNIVTYYNKYTTLSVPPSSYKRAETVGNSLYSFVNGGAFYKHDFTGVTWSKIQWSPFPNNVDDYASTVINGEIYYYGGTTSNGDGNIVSYYGFTKYDPAADKWTQLTPTRPGNPPFAGTQMVTLNGNIYFIYNGHLLYRYDSGANRIDALSPAGSPPSNRTYPNVVGMNGKIYVFGGYSGGMDLNDLYEYDPGTNQWTSLMPQGTAPTGRSDAVAGIYNNKMYIYGGYSNSSAGYVDDLYEFDPDGYIWTKITASGGPVVRGSTNFTLHGSELIMYGGKKSSTVFNELWSLSIVPDSTSTPLITSADMNGGHLQ